MTASNSPGTTAEQRAQLAQSVGDRCKKARRFAGMDQTELAERIEVNRNTISNYEKDSVRQQRIVLRQWALACGLPLEWLQTGEWPAEGPDDGGIDAPVEDGGPRQIRTDNLRIKSPAFVRDLFAVPRDLAVAC